MIVDLLVKGERRSGETDRIFMPTAWGRAVKRLHVAKKSLKTFECHLNGEGANQRHNSPITEV
jgi:hypothetical protein